MATWVGFLDWFHGMQKHHPYLRDISLEQATLIWEYIGEAGLPLEPDEYQLWYEKFVKDNNA